eukprot:6471920-Prorocentrum_lima.AAC.1
MLAGGAGLTGEPWGAHAKQRQHPRDHLLQRSARELHFVSSFLSLLVLFAATAVCQGAGSNAADNL